MNILNSKLVKQLTNRATETVESIPENGYTTLMCSPTVTIPRAQLLKWEKASRRHQDIIAEGLKDGAKVLKTKFGGFIMK